MSTELFAGKKPRRASSPLRVPFRVDSAELRRQAANMLHAFAERLQNELARQGILPPPAIELWLDVQQQFCVRDNHPYADDILAVLETPSYYLHFKNLETLYELLECANSGALAQDSHLHIGLSSAGPVAFLCVHCDRSLAWRPRNRPCGKDGSG